VWETTTTMAVSSRWCAKQHSLWICASKTVRWDAAPRWSRRTQSRPSCKSHSLPIDPLVLLIRPADCSRRPSFPTLAFTPRNRHRQWVSTAGPIFNTRGRCCRHGPSNGAILNSHTCELYGPECRPTLR